MSARPAARGRLRVLVAIVATVVVPAMAFAPIPPLAAAAGDNPLRVYVLVTDGLGPREVVPQFMPRLAALAEEGTWYEQASAVLVAETLPNHVAMATGMLPRSNGIVGNSAFDPRRPGAGDVQLDDPDMLLADTTVTRLERDCPRDVSTATIQSKTYLFDIFRQGERQRQADLHWNAEPFYIPGSNHALDQLTMQRLREWVFVEQPATPQYAFVNLGDIDRSGHLDPTGVLTNGEYPAGRRGAMADTDALIATFVEGLKAQGWWEDTVLVIASDHAMDFSAPDDYVDLEDALWAAGLKVGLDPATDDVGFSENGGAALVYVHAQAKRPLVEAVLDQLDGVEHVLSAARGDLARYGLDHPRAGDFAAFVEDGRRFASGELGSSNPIPGNHGHAVTQPSVLLVAGGHESLTDPQRVGGATVYDPQGDLHRPETGPGNLSIAPTVAALFGLHEPAKPYDGKVLTEALAQTPAGHYCAAARPGANRPGDDGGEVADLDGDRQPGGPSRTGAGSGGVPPALPATGGGIGAGVALLAAAALVLQLRRQ